MPRTTDISRTVERYTRADYTALRAVLNRVPISVVLNRYYSEDDCELLGLSSAADLGRRIDGMRDMLIARATDSNPHLAKFLDEARGRGIWSARAIDTLVKAAERDSSTPRPSDPLSLWIKPRVAARLNDEGCKTVMDLANLINVRGSVWYYPIPYFGRGSATTIERWFDSYDSIRSLIDKARLLPAVPAQDVVLYDGYTRELVPLERIRLAPQLDGHAGLFRHTGLCLIQAKNDALAIASYLAKFADRPKAKRAYQKEITRFLLFCVIELRKPMSSADVDDCNSYVKFLKDPPSSWCAKKGAPRMSSAWRPFVGPLSDRSQYYAVTVLRSFYTWLLKAAYLSGNPWALAITPSAVKPELPMQIEKALSVTLWQKLSQKDGILDWLCSLSEDELRLHITPYGIMTSGSMLKQMRLIRAVVLLMGETGLRREETTTAVRNALKPNAKYADLWELSVVGKGRKSRTVPVPLAVVEAIRAHWEDLGLDFDNAKSDSALFAPVVFPKTKATKQRHGEDDDTRTPVAFTADGLGRMVERSLTQIANDTANQFLTPDDRANLIQAAAHALRHTFGTCAVADEVPIDVVQKAMGHESLTTTTIYVQADKERMLAQMSERLAKRKRKELLTAEAGANTDSLA